MFSDYLSFRKSFAYQALSQLCSLVPVLRLRPDHQSSLDLSQEWQKLSAKKGEIDQGRVILISLNVLDMIFIEKVALYM